MMPARRVIGQGFVVVIRQADKRVVQVNGYGCWYPEPR